MIGSCPARDRARSDARKRAGFPRKLASAFLAFALAVSLVPSAAWAEVAAPGGGAPSRAPVEQEVSSEDTHASAEGGAHPAGEGAAAPGESPEASGASDAFSEEAAPSTESPSANAPEGGPAVAGDEEGDSASKAEGVSSGVPSDGAESPSGVPASLAGGSAEAAEVASEGEGSEISATASLVGRDARGAAQTWAASRSYTLDADASVADITEAMFAACGIEASVFAPPSGSSWQVNSITSPFDGDIVLEADFETGEEWHVFVNGVEVDQYDPYLHKRVLSEGDAVVWFYSAPGEEPPAAELSASLSLVGQDARGVAQTWLPETAISLPQGATAADLTEALFAQEGIKADIFTPEAQGYWMLNEVTSPFDPDVRLSWDAQTGAFWQLFVNGEMANAGADALVLQPGDVVTWCYGADGALPGQVRASLQVIGRDADGVAQTWLASAEAALVEGSTAADLTKLLFEKEGLGFQASQTDWGWSLDSITSPYDEDLTLGTVQEGGVWRYWQLLVNGEPCDSYADGYELRAGDAVTWYHAAFGEELPNEDGIVVSPDAPRPDWEAFWPGFASGAASTQAPTPAGEAQEAWVSDLKDPSDYGTYVSDPLVVNGRVYVAVGRQLRVFDAATGARVGVAALAAPIDSVARMVYADGIVVVPLSGGRLQAITADALATVWLTAELAAIDDTGKQQALSSLTVGEGCVFFGTASAAWSGESYNGYLACVSLADGSVLWQERNEEAGYYWSGAALVDDWLVVGDDAGVLSVRSSASGVVEDGLDLGAPIRSTAVAGTREGTVLVATSDGVLHKVLVDARTGALSEEGRVKFGSSSTSTPTVAGGKVYVGGASREGVENEWGYVTYGGVLAVIDEGSLALEREVLTYGEDALPLPGDSKSAPLVSTQNGGTYVYFTCNAQPGGIYRYRVGDASAQLMYEPDAAHAQYCLSSVVCGPDGMLYYVNDSGALFAVGAASTGEGGGDGSGGEGGGSQGPVDSNLPAGPNTPVGGEGAGEGTEVLQGQGVPVALPPAKRPLSPDDVREAGEEAAFEAAALSMEPRSGAGGSGRAADASQENEGSSREVGLPWLPVAGIVVGACGLAASLAWLARAKRGSREGGSR